MKIDDLEELINNYFERDITLVWVDIEEIEDFDFEKAKMDNFSYQTLDSEIEETQDSTYVDYIRYFIQQDEGVRLSIVIDLTLELIHKCWSSYCFFLIEYYYQNATLVDISFDKIVEKARKAFLKQKELYPKSLIREFLIYCKEFYEIEFDQISNTNLSRENFLFAKSIIEDEDVSIEAVRRKYTPPTQ